MKIGGTVFVHLLMFDFGYCPLIMRDPACCSSSDSEELELLLLLLLLELESSFPLPCVERVVCPKLKLISRDQLKNMHMFRGNLRKRT